MAGVVKTSDIKEAPVKTEDGYTKVVSPLGAVTTVPDNIVEALTDSGYTTQK